MKRFFVTAVTRFFLKTPFAMFAVAHWVSFRTAGMVKIDLHSAYRTCQHRTKLDCNWLVPHTDSNPQCRPAA